MDTFTTEFTEEKKITAVIFDLDGTLVDSEPIYLESDRMLFSRFPEIQFDEAFKNKYIGIGAYDMIADLKSKYHIPHSIEELLVEKNRLYMELARKKTALFPEMKRFLDKLKKAGFRLSVASGSSKEVIHEILDLTKIRHYFESITSAEEVPKGKPDPAIFLKAADKLGLPPEECLTIEDSWPGVKAAKGASMLCIAVPTVLLTELNPVFHSADLLIEKGMSEFDAEEAFRWVQRRC